MLTTVLGVLDTKGRKDLTGLQFFRLTAVKCVLKKKRVYWLCKCACGVEKEIRGDGLQTGAVKSCGCLRREQAKLLGKSTPQWLPNGERPKRALFTSKKSHAKYLGHEFALSKEQFFDLVSKPCSYCGTPPSNIKRHEAHYDNTFQYSGLDRVDSSKGYTTSNTVPCCQRCNKAKMDGTVEDFLAWAKKLVTFQEANAKTRKHTKNF